MTHKPALSTIAMALIAPLLVSAVPQQNLDANSLDTQGLTEKQLTKLEKLLAGRKAGRTSICINQVRIRSFKAVGDNILIYRMRNGQVFVNQPVNGCPSPDRNALITDKPTTQLCRGDIAEVVDFRAGGISRGSCSFSEFVEYEKTDTASAN